MGDLKDQLGIKHRKEKKNRDTSPSNLEAAPMFHEQHSRSMSELSTHNAYEPTVPVTPLSRAGELSPRFPPSSPQNFASSNSFLAPPPPPSPGRADAPSPSPSYYSASDIPPPSPLPPTQYRLASGELTTTPPTRRTSVATRNSLLHSPPTSPPPPPILVLLHPQTSQTQSGLMRRLSGSGGG